MIRLSVNLNKVALLRNARHTGVPNLLEFAHIALDAGADGLTVHPRPDERHIRRQDSYDLAELMGPVRPRIEYNIEGRPTEDFLKLIEEIRPEQCTLVPDSPEAFTSDSGWRIDREKDLLIPVIQRLKALGSRVILFMDPDAAQIAKAGETGADGIEIYTGDYAAAFRKGEYQQALKDCFDAAACAVDQGLVVNAGHDLNTENLRPLAALPGLHEVSIGHELTADALIHGFAEAVRMYKAALGG